MSKKKVLVAMSGGVDSSVAAALLKQQGYDVVGMFMRLGSPGESLELDQCDETSPAQPNSIGRGCCSIGDAADARLVSAMLEIPFYVCNFKQDFGKIIDYFVAEYNAGRTPNPCIRCNDWLKFGKLHEYAKQIDADFIASGHYARITHGKDKSGVQLRTGLDSGKDQSYVLFGIPRNQLSTMLLPIGGYHKSEVRALAKSMGLPVSDKPDSQEICFVPDDDYAGLVGRQTPDAMSAGAILDLEGNEIGQHPGQQHFTIGQRRGVGVALGYPIYVVNRDANSNTITVGPRDALSSIGCIAHEINWLTDPIAVGESMRCFAKIRYNAAAEAAILTRTDEDLLEVRFDEPQFAIAPGQAVVCYLEDEPSVVAVGGWIV